MQKASAGERKKSKYGEQGGGILQPRAGSQKLSILEVIFCFSKTSTGIPVVAQRPCDENFQFTCDDK